MSKLFVNTDDMVYNKIDGQVMAGGYAVNSLFLAENIPLFKQAHAQTKSDQTKSDQNKSDQNKSDQNKLVEKREKFSDRFQNLAVPAGFLYVNTNMNPINMNPINMNPINMNPINMNPINMNPETDSQPINDDLYNKLLALVETTDDVEHDKKDKPAKKKKTTRKQKNKKAAQKKTKKSLSGL